jgi:hypothetical protein
MLGRCLYRAEPANGGLRAQVTAAGTEQQLAVAVGRPSCTEQGTTTAERLFEGHAS